jgi:hypothetical protein
MSFYEQARPESIIYYDFHLMNWKSAITMIYLENHHHHQLAMLIFLL